MPLDLMARSEMGDSDLNLGMFRLNGSGQRERLFLFTMDKENLIWSRGDCPHVGQEILAIRMGREPIELDNLRPPWSGQPVTTSVAIAEAVSRQDFDCEDIVTDLINRAEADLGLARKRGGNDIVSLEIEKT